MLLVVTDTGRIWNHENPFLEKYKDIVLVVCLKGEKVTDKYECLVIPRKYTKIKKYNFFLDGLLKSNEKDSVRENFEREFGCREDIVFLSDNEPSSLYPYYFAKEHDRSNRLHLVAMPPMNFESNSRIKLHRSLLSDLSRVSSVLYYDADKLFRKFDKSKNLNDFYDCVRDDLGKMMPRFLSGIYHRKYCQQYFDFASMKYVCVKDGFDGMDFSKKEVDEDFPIKREFRTMGIIGGLSYYPEKDNETKDYVERPIARVDGKKICNVLREQRIKLAEANNIPFESEECLSIGACAGTCPKCEKESAYLLECMEKIPEKNRVYPQFDPFKEVIE